MYCEKRSINEDDLTCSSMQESGVTLVMALNDSFTELNDLFFHESDSNH